MGGGLMQLVAYGDHDLYLTGNPQITFFKVVYRRHANFAMESIEQTFNGSADFGKRVTATISRNVDLVKDMWLEVDFGAAVTGSVYGLGNALVKQVEVEIGGQLIDRQYGEWMNIWSELSVPEGKREVYDEMVGNENVITLTAGSKQKMDVPLMFWFNRNPGLALPLIALQYHEVKLNLDFETAANLQNDSDETDLSNPTIKLWVDYIYLDTDERRRFAQVSHEYLIEQVQFTGDETVTTGSNNLKLNFNHPVKELIWVEQVDNQKRGSGVQNASPDATNSTNPCQFTTMVGATAKLQLNGHDRFTERRMEYFGNVQTYKHHSHGPRSNRVTNFATDQVVNQHIYCYSFALNPEEHQPSGTCNFSRIDNATLVLSSVPTAGTLKVFAVNYNVLRVMSGMGGLAYSN
jgi:hypothetical protein